MTGIWRDSYSTVVLGKTFQREKVALQSGGGPCNARVVGPPSARLVHFPPRAAQREPEAPKELFAEMGKKSLLSGSRQREALYPANNAAEAHLEWGT